MNTSSSENKNELPESEESASSSSSSSFLMQLQGKLRSGLQPTTTKFVQHNGSVKFFKNHGTEILSATDNEFKNSCNSNTLSFGFVVDTKPDLSVGKVLPWLYVSSQDVAQDSNILQNLGITHILSLLPGFQLIPCVQSVIKQHLVLEFYDEEIFTVDGKLSTLHVIGQALDFITNAKESKDYPAKVLVHCNAGMSRAPTIVILYLMKKENMTFSEAFEKVKVARPITKPNSGFLNYLQTI